MSEYKEPYQVDIRKFSTFLAFKKCFLSKIPNEYSKEENKDICWNWQGSLPAGYGTITWEGVRYSAHKLSYIIFNGLIPQGEVIRHTCNNPRCVNPKHLLRGSYYDNQIDMIKAGRGGHQKLNEEAIKVIKWMLKYKPKRGLASKLARLHKVTPETIAMIKNGCRWGWVTI